MGTGDNHGDMAAHTMTYTGVMSLLKWGSAAAAFFVAIVILLIAH